MTAEKPKTFLNPNVLLETDSITVSLRMPKALKEALDTYVPKALKATYVRHCLAKLFLTTSTQEELIKQLVEMVQETRQAVAAHKEEAESRG